MGEISGYVIFVVEPHVDPCRAGAIGRGRCVAKPGVEVVVAAAERLDRVLDRQSLEAHDLPGRGVVSSAFGGFGQGRHDLGFSIQIVQERVEIVGWHDGLV